MVGYRPAPFMSNFQLKEVIHVQTKCRNFNSVELGNKKSFSYEDFGDQQWVKNSFYSYNENGKENWFTRLHLDRLLRRLFNELVCFLLTIYIDDVTGLFLKNFFLHDNNNMFLSRVSRPQSHQYVHRSPMTTRILLFEYYQRMFFFWIAKSE